MQPTRNVNSWEALALRNAYEEAVQTSPNFRHNPMNQRLHTTQLASNATMPQHCTFLITASRPPSLTNGQARTWKGLAPSDKRAAGLNSHSSSVPSFHSYGSLHETCGGTHRLRAPADHCKEAGVAKPMGA